MHRLSPSTASLRSRSPSPMLALLARGRKASPRLRVKSSYWQLHIQRRVERVVLDEFAPGLDDVAHELGEEVVGLVGVLDLDEQERARVLVERRLPELLGVHFPEALVALQRKALAAPFEDGVEQLARRAHLALFVLSGKDTGLEVRRLQAGRQPVELARIGTCDHRAVDRHRLAHAPDFAPEFHPAVGRRLAVPATFGLVAEL